MAELGKVREKRLEKMKYVKPEVTRLGSALETVRSDTLKVVNIVFENPPIDGVRGTSAAYEADE